MGSTDTSQVATQDKPDPTSEESSSYSDKSIRGLSWTMLSTVLQAVGYFVLMLVLARMLDARAFGLANISQIVIGFLMLAGQAGVGRSLIQLPDESEGLFRTVHTVSVGLCTVLAAIVSLLSPWIASGLGEPAAAPLVAVATVGFLLQAFGQAPDAYLQRRFAFKKLAIIDSISFVVGFCFVGLLFAFLKLGAWSLIAASLAQQFIRTVGMHLGSRRRWPFGVDRSLVKTVITFSSGHSLGALLNYVALSGDKMMVSRIMGAGELGVYGRAYVFLVMPVQFFGKVVNQVLFSGMARLQDDPTRLATGYKKALSLVSLLAIPASVYMIVEARLIVEVLLGKNWMSVVPPLQILAVSLLPRMAYGVSLNLVTATGNPMRRAIPSALYALAVLVGSYFGAKYYGLSGVAFAVAIAILLNDTLLVRLGCNVTGLKFGQVFACYLRGIPLALLVGAGLITFNATFGNTASPAVLKFILSIFLTFGLVGVATKIGKRIFFGSELDWLLQRLSKVLKKGKAKPVAA